MTRTISVVVCDDVPGMRRLARIVLEEEGDVSVIGEAADGRTAIQEISRLQPDVVVLDLSMPELDGLEAIPLIHEVAPRAQIVVFSGFEEEKLADAALSRSASRYVRKGAPLHELRQAVRAVAPAAG
ncbi:MAG: two-component system, OmpR family, sensor kinase [Solirubrobacteraceae bacterium]|nr:two-component system, OmpR family, sensor kinase [Solirubrobacteraceae bacterium]MDX6671087.1 two-component system, OmpR family, sensor kinase [Solirubrobacteraceae bacterium]